jgi:hypothetical protein
MHPPEIKIRVTGSGTLVSYWPDIPQIYIAALKANENRKTPEGHSQPPKEIVSLGGVTYRRIAENTQIYTSVTYRAEAKKQPVQANSYIIKPAELSRRLRGDAA